MKNQEQERGDQSLLDGLKIETAWANMGAAAKDAQVRARVLRLVGTKTVATMLRRRAGVVS